MQDVDAWDTWGESQARYPHVAVRGLRLISMLLPLMEQVMSLGQMEKQQRLQLGEIAPFRLQSKPSGRDLAEVTGRREMREGLGGQLEESGLYVNRGYFCACRVHGQQN